MIINKEVVEWAKSYDGVPFHALFCDPPYHLTSITKRFGKEGSAPAKYGKDGAFSRISKGFMGQEWDGGDVAFNPETWKAFKNILHDGAFGMAFASSRGWHRLAIAIEDAGFVIHPTIFGWAYGSGFPKGVRIDTQIDRVLGNERKKVRKKKKLNVSESVSELAKVWENYRYGSQALKPALEPIIVFQKPYKGKPMGNIVKNGAGAWNIEGSRIGKEIIPSNRWKDNAHPFGGGAGNEYETVENKGRWPSNLILYDNGAKEVLGDKAKFYYTVEEQIDTTDPVFYMKKANRKERNDGLEGMKEKRKAQLSGAQGKGELDDVSSRYLSKPMSNIHPTVKPIELAKYLATLLLPPKMYAPRRIFVPFAGVMSEAIGCALAGWEDVTAVEMSEEYCEIGLARVKHWAGKL